MRQSDQPFRNAIRALNINGTQVGHIPKAVAAKLAPLLDQGKITIEGTMLEGNSKSSALQPGKASL
jgi:SWI/SNF-related matrix-associated actin-dependent regulator of chromatin subfamily A3